MATTEGRIVLIAEIKSGIVGTGWLLVVGGGVKLGLMAEGVIVVTGVGVDPRPK